MKNEFNIPVSKNNPIKISGNYIDHYYSMNYNYIINKVRIISNYSHIKFGIGLLIKYKK